MSSNNYNYFRRFAALSVCVCMPHLFREKERRDYVITHSPSFSLSFPLSLSLSLSPSLSLSTVMLQLVRIIIQSLAV